MVCLLILSYPFPLLYLVFHFLSANRQNSSQTTIRAHLHSADIRTGAHTFIRRDNISQGTFSPALLKVLILTFSFLFHFIFPFLVLLRNQKPQMHHRIRQHRRRLPIPTMRNLQRYWRAEAFGLPPGRAAGCIGIGSV
jgi:hypothetical protein